jgi:hypothetical protein
MHTHQHQSKDSVDMLNEPVNMLKERGELISYILEGDDDDKMQPIKQRNVVREKRGIIQQKIVIPAPEPMQELEGK